MVTSFLYRPCMCSLIKSNGVRKPNSGMLRYCFAFSTRLLPRSSAQDKEAVSDKASSFLKDIKLLFQFTKKENIDPSFVRLIKNEIESRFEDFKQAMNGKSLESMMC